MTDNEIINALAICCGVNNLGCRECPLHSFYSANCVKSIINKALDLINRQKAEIERLQGTVEMYEEERKYHFEMSKQKVAEAYKEFAERLKEKAYRNNYCQDVVLSEEINNLVKELTEKGR